MQLNTYPTSHRSYRSIAWAIGLWLLTCCAPAFRCAADQPLSTELLQSRAELGLRLIERSSQETLQQRECFSCHHQSLPLLAFQHARLRGLKVDLDNLVKQAERSIEHLKRGEQQYREGRGQGGKVDMAGYALWGLSTADWIADSTTDAVVEYLLQAQESKGHWTCESNRPPSEVSDITTSALALKGLAAYADRSLGERVAKRRRDFAAWLKQQKPEDTESRVFGLLAAKELGLAETGQALATMLLESQRTDGGWAQLPDMDSDAYATATALVALAQSEYASASLSDSSSAYRRGLQYLLNTQQADGSWHVVSRSRPFQTYFESGFPHGKDQFISIAASCWAIMALLEPLPRVVESSSLRAQMPWHSGSGKTAKTSSTAPPAAATAAELEFFEREIRPLLAERCGNCHGAEKQFANLRTDSLASLLAGGDSGPALVPKHTQRSLLIQAVKRQGELKMPPDDPLAAADIARLERWIDMGAPWSTESTTPADARNAAAKSHWAFQPVKPAAPPTTRERSWSRNAIDQFILAKLESHDLPHSPEADERTLLRRLSYDLVGLPPRFEDFENFQSDHRPDAYDRLVDRWLASPRLGEHWGRHWLDVARYSDTKGYVYAREERNFVHAAMYRDWVIAAFNSDLPFDRFVEYQLAADQVADADPAAQAAMGFLTLGRRFLGVTHDIADDRIDVVTRGLLGLTVACARCHDHKFDPISSAEYYSLASVFHNSTERRVSTRAMPVQHDATEQAGPWQPSPWEIELAKRQAKYQERLATEREAAAERVRAKFKDYLLAQLELEKIPAEGFDVIIGKDDLVPAQVRRVQAYLLASATGPDPIFDAWNQYAAIPASEFTQAAPGVTAALKRRQPEELNLLVARCFDSVPASMQEVAQRYGELFAKLDKWESSDVAEQQAASKLRELLSDPKGPAAIPDEDIVSIEQYFASSVCTELWKLQGEIDRWINQAETPAEITTILVDRNPIGEPRVLRRGNPRMIGEQVPRQFLSVATPQPQAPWPLTSGSGRRELAAAIIHPDNPLTLRVWTNRLWQHLFGVGLVATPSDFGLRAAPPSHPELLDWLAINLRQHEHSSKHALRQILLSSTYRQSSIESHETDHYARARELDPENRLLWRVSPKRLTFEQQRDSWLAAARGLEEKAGGRGRSMFDAPDSNPRRSVYGLVDRQFLPGVMRVFDFANPDLHTPQRSETTVPQQALFALNHPFAAHVARQTAAAALAEAQRSPNTDENPHEARITQLFRLILGRNPISLEVARASMFIDQAEQAEVKPRQEPMAWSYGYAKFDPAAGTLGPFTVLPHFTGSAWQGGPQWPDKKLGWVQLTAVGGHAGNDLEHAAVRRWTAPQAGTYAVRSLAVHDTQAGDGIRCSIISSRSGLLKSSLLHNQKMEFQVVVDALPGDTLDFVVDIHGNLNNDQFQWSPEIVRQPSAMPSDPAAESTQSSLTRWRADRDFVGPTPAQLDAWAQLAQVLLLSNELTFVD